MLITFDPLADAIYVSLRRRSDGDVARTEELGDDRQVDYNAEGDLLGVEFLGVSQGLNLEGVPHASEIEAGLRAFPMPATA